LMKNFFVALESNFSLKKLYFPKFSKENYEDLIKLLKINKNLTKILIPTHEIFDKKFLEEFRFYCCCNKMWTARNHIKCAQEFRSACYFFLLCLNRIQKNSSFKLPKFVLFEIIKLIDRRSFWKIALFVENKKNSCLIK
jgi:hypothetical protein